MDWLKILGATLTGGLLTGAQVLGNDQATNAATEASRLQSGAAQAGIDEQRRQFDEIQKLLAPYVGAGTGALSAQQDLSGLNGPEAYQKAVDAIQNNPEFSAMIQQGETGILQNASATGGLRGGNTQGALAQFRPQLLNQAISNQYARLGGLSQMGQQSALGQGQFGQQSALNISQLLQQQAAAQAGGVLARGNQTNNLINSLLQTGGAVLGAAF